MPNGPALGGAPAGGDEIEALDEATPERVAFWLRAPRTPRLLRDAVTRFPAEAAAWVERRPAVAAAPREP